MRANIFVPSNTIMIWRWEDAPEDYRKLSEHGGDENWVAFIPASLAGEYIPFLDDGRFSNSVQEVLIAGVGVVKIGAHA